MNLKRWVTLLAFAALSAAGFWLAGCETGGGGDSNLEGQYLFVEPATVTLSADNASVVVGAAGGKGPYTWSVSDSALGTVATNGTKVTYTRTTATGLNNVYVRDSQGWTAHGEITQN